MGSLEDERSNGFAIIPIVEAGGYSTARSMRFQNLWAVQQVLHVLAEELRSVRIEPAGLEGKGVDLIITLPDGRTEFQQCKRSNRQAGKWTLRALENEGVLAALRDRLSANHQGLFRLVSADPAPELRDLCDSALDSLDAESFLRDQVGASEERQKALQVFSRALQLDPLRTDDLSQIYDFLRRVSTTLVGDDQDVFRDLRSQARCWVDGDPHTIVSSLESYTQQTLRSAITAANIENFLRNQGLHLRALTRDPRLLPAIRHLRERFEESLEPYLVGGTLLLREEAGQLFEWLMTEKGPTFIAVHGPPGVGKSGVLLALTRRLQQEGILYLPLRLDRQRPYGIARQFGHSLGLPESPALCLKAAASEGIGVLVLDQLDALRWTGSQAAEALETCRELVREAMQAPNLKVVACCRSFDLENDPQISGWVERQHARKLPVGRLSEEAVKQVVTGVGIDPERVNPRQIDLLRSIHHLRAWEQTIKVTGKVVDFATERELLDAFWRSRLLEAESMGASAAAVREAVDGVVSYMDKNGTLIAPRRLLLGSGHVEQVLLSLQVLTATDDNVTFSHQTYLDHQLAHLLLRRIDEGKTTVEEWLTAGHQSLFRREQLRLVLGLLREERSGRYITALQALLVSPSLRFHLKQVVLQFLGQVDDPRSAEIELVSSLFEEEQWQEHVIADVYHAHPRWIDSPQGTRFLANWLEAEEWKREQALRVIRSIVKERGQLCHGLLAPYLDRGDDWNRRIAAVLPQAPVQDSPELFALRIRLVELGIGFLYIDWEGLGGTCLDRLVQLLSVVLFRLGGDDATSPPSSALLRSLEEIEFSDTSLEALTGAWSALLPAAASALRPGDYRSRSHDWRSPLRELLRRLGGELVSRDPLGTFDLVEQSNVPLEELLLLEALPQVDDTQVADRALGWLMSSPHRLRLRWSASDLPWQVSRSAIEQLTRVCSPELYSSFERFLIEFQEPRLRQKMEYRHEYMLFPPEGQPKFLSRALTQPSPAGESAYHLLPCLPEERLSDLGRRRLRELQRKFDSVDSIFFSGRSLGQGGSVGSPLPHERLNTLSDRTWLDIIANNRTSRSGMYRGYRNGRFEKSSPGTFASDLQTATVQKPGRFARLALRFPADSNPRYFGAVLQGLAAEAQNYAVGQDASLEELEGLLALPTIITEPRLALAVARLIAHRPQLDWSPSALRLLCSIATNHPDPGVGELHVGDREDWGPENLVTNALNCTRGEAAFAIARLLFNDEKRLPLLSETIESLVLDPHPAVRAAVFECCLAILHVAPEHSLAWALQAADGHEALLACATFDRFVRYASQDCPDEMEATINRMLASPREDVVLAGARHAVALHLLFGRMDEVVKNCIHGTTARRVGAAQVAAAFADTPEYHPGARAILAELMNDDEGKVLEACAETLQDTALDLFADSLEFLNTYAASRAFQSNPSVLLHRLREYPGSLVPFASCVLEVCRNLATAKKADRDRSFWEVDYYLSPVLLRLYEQAPEGSEVREKSLDAWDLLLRARVASAVSLTKKLEIES